MRIQVGAALLIGLFIVWVLSYVAKAQQDLAFMVLLVIIALGLAVAHFAFAERTVTIKPSNPLAHIRQETAEELDKASRNTVYWQRRYQERKSKE